MNRPDFRYATPDDCGLNAEKQEERIVKRLIRYMLAMLLVAGALVFGNAGIAHGLMPDTVAAEAATLKLNKKKVTLEKGATYKLKIKGMPEGAKLVKFKSSKRSVAKVGKKTTESAHTLRSLAIIMASGVPSSFFTKSAR